MKSLIDYIVEKRELIQNLPFDYELFEQFIQICIIDAEYDDSPIWDKMRQTICDTYNKSVWRWFQGWCEGYLEVQNKLSIEDFYNNMKNIPKDRLGRVLGSGSNGIVMDLGDKVMKIYYGDKIKSIDAPFIEWCSKHNSKVFPKVYKIGKNWCTMEKLEINTPKCQKYMYIIDNEEFDGLSPISDIAKGKKVKDVSILTKDQLEVYEWCIAVKEEMDKINHKAIGYPGDLVINNIGERKNGDIVFFDI